MASNHLRLASRILGLPGIYDLFQRAVGGTSSRKKIIAEIVRATPGDRILDIGCGPGTMVPYFPDTQYFGFDGDPAYIAAARQKFGERATFQCARVRDYLLDPEQRSSFDIVLAFGVLHHVDDEEALQLFRLAKEALKPSGRLITLDGCYEASQTRWARILLRWDRGQHVRDQRGYLELAGHVFPRTLGSIHHNLLNIPYTLIVLECTN
jgi:SAM-dependent methyltransferase